MEEPWSGNLKASVSKESSCSHLCRFQQAGLSISVFSSEHGRAGDNIQTSTSAGDCPCQGHMQLTGNLEIALFLCVRWAISQSVLRWKSPT